MGSLGRGAGRVSCILLVTLYPAYRAPLLCLSPGPAKDMQPTMKFVMDTSKYWFKPSITREQGKARTVSQRTSHSVIMSGLVLCSRQMGPWVMVKKNKNKKQVGNKSLQKRVGDLLDSLGNEQNMQKVDGRKTSWGQTVV